MRPHRAPRRHARRGARADLLAARPPSSCATGSPRASGRPCRPAMCSTFHSFAYGLIRRYTPPELYDGPLRLLQRPGAGRRAPRAAHRRPRVGAAGPTRCARALGTRGFAREVHAVLGRAREKGLDGDALRAARASARPAGVRRGRAVPRAVPHDPRPPERHRLRRPDPARRDRGRRAPRRAARAVHATSSSTSTRTPTPARSRCSGRSPATAATSPWSATRTSRSTPSAAPRCAASSTSPRVPAPRRRAGRRRSRCGTTRRFGPRLLTAPRAGRRPAAAARQRSTPRPLARRSSPRSPTPGPRRRPGRGAHLRHRARRGRAPRRPAAPRPPRGRHRLGRHGRAGALGRTSIPALRRALGAAGVPVEVAGDDVPLVREPAVLPLLDALRAVLNLDNDDRRPRRLRRPGPGRGPAARSARRARRRRRAPPRPRPAGPREGARPEAGRPPARRASCSARPSSSRRLPRRLGVRRPSERRALRAPASGARRARRGRTAEEVLWPLWSGTAWPRAAAARGRSRAAAPPAAPTATSTRCCALFDAAARAEEQRDHLGVRHFLATLVAQQIPADTLAERGVRGAAVRLLTAHRSKGLEWRLVVVAHVQERAGPTSAAARPCSRPTASASDGAGRRRSPPASCSPRSAGCSTSRAPAPASGWSSPRWRPPTTTASSRRGSSASSGVDVDHVTGRPPRPLSLAGLVRELRRTVADPETRRRCGGAAARRLARLAGRPSATAAGPAWRTPPPGGERGRRAFPRGRCATRTSRSLSRQAFSSP